MSTAIKILQGAFGRVALLCMDKPLVAHAHHHCHLLIKLSGADTRFVVRERVQALTDRNAVVVNAWESHAYAHHDEKGMPTVLLAMYIEPTWLADIQRALAVSGHPHFFPQPSVAMSEHARTLADELAADMLLPDGIAPGRLEERLFDLIIAIIDRNSEWRNFSALLRTMPGCATDARIRRAIAMMRANIGSGQDMDHIAVECGLSRAHFFALFRRCTNLTPAVYVNVLRMEAAIRDLSEGSASIADIGYEVGFSAPGHFTRFFRDQLGVTPSEYRRVVSIVDERAEALVS